MVRNPQQDVARSVVGIDTGGTFTDLIAVDGSRTSVRKVASTPDDPPGAILDALEHFEGRDRWNALTRIVHGTTVATNALIERRGARVAFVTTRGFRDVLDLARQDRPLLHDLDTRRPDPLVPQDLRFEVDERIGAGGEVIRPLTEEVLTATVEAVAQSGAESIAIGFLFSPEHPDHELRMARALATVGVPVVTSAELLPELREYERFSTVTASAYVAPIIGRAVSRLGDRVAPASLGIMDSSGGVRSVDRVTREAARTVLSGPAGGAVAARELCRRRGTDGVAFDMGGTSTDVTLVRKNRVTETRDFRVGGLPVALPVTDIHTVGAGGGSIGWVDAGGALRVGPRSAGSVPGPVVYGRGGSEPTVTDAAFVLGRLPRALKLGGTLALDDGAVERAFRDVAQPLSMSPIELALGMTRVVVAEMARAVRRVTQQRGVDPRDLELIAFGGAAGLHAVALARELDMQRVVVPPAPGVFSAAGMLLAPPVHSLAATVMKPWSPDLEVELSKQIDQQITTVLPAGLEPDRKVRRQLSMRVRGQAHCLDVMWTEQISAAHAFEAEYRDVFGVGVPSHDFEVVGWRVAIESSPAWDSLPDAKAIEADDAASNFPSSGTVEVILDDGSRAPAPLVMRGQITDSRRGPLVVIEKTATLWVPPGARVSVGGTGELVVEMGSSP